MGGEEDPKDGGAVAGALFGAVFIYIVCSYYHVEQRDSLTGYRASSFSADCRPSFTCAKAVVAR